MSQNRDMGHPVLGWVLERQLGSGTECAQDRFTPYLKDWYGNPGG
jgi:hypothetical protein